MEINPYIYGQLTFWQKCQGNSLGKKTKAKTIKQKRTGFPTNSSGKTGHAHKKKKRQRNKTSIQQYKLKKKNYHKMDQQPT